jgi:hypothetical protein
MPILSIVYKRSGFDQFGKPQYSVSWEVVGSATSIEDAKRQGFRYPVLGQP